MNITETDKKYIAGTYNRFPVEIVKGKGSLVYDSQGKRYIDLGSGIGVTSFGICDDVWQEAVTAQLQTVNHTSNLYYTEPCAKLAKMLCERTGMKKVFFSNSGAEANECAIKVARKYSQDKKGKDFSTIITLKNSFHGRTLTTLAATGQDKFHELFNPLTPGFVSVTPDDKEEIRKLAEETKIAGIMIECIQGEGGVVPLSREYVEFIRNFTHKNDIPMIVDEVQTGNGRTGKLYSYMNFDIMPDIVSTAKGLGGGLPLGATMMAEGFENVSGFGDHGSTFGGNPVCCAGAISIIERMDDKFLENVTKKGELIREKLSECGGVEDIKGMGLMLGIKTKKPAKEVISECISKGVLCLSAKDKVRLLPALNIPEDVLEEALEIIKEACGN